MFGIGAGPCATESCELRQVRKEATVSGRVCVPQDHLAPNFSGKSEKWKVRSEEKAAKSFSVFVVTPHSLLKQTPNA